MPRRYRLSHPAVRGALIGGSGLAVLIVVAGAVALIFWQAPNNPNAEYQYSYSEKAEGDPSAFPLSLDEVVSAETYRAICEKPEDRDHADLCQQWRMAQAAKQQLVWLERQFWLTLLEILGLLAALGFSAWASIAASRAVRVGEVSAKAARKAITVSMDTARRELRAYVFTETYRLEAPMKGKRPKAIFKINNAGQTPARNVRVFGDIRVCDHPMLASYKFPVFEKWNPGVMVGHPGVTFNGHVEARAALTEEEVQSLYDGTRFLTIFGHVEYLDIYDRHRKTRFCLYLLNPGDYLNYDAKEGDIPFLWNYAERHNAAD